eukprot:15473379-Alexandrium_andersonii.AAC.1
MTWRWWPAGSGASSAVAARWARRAPLELEVVRHRLARGLALLVQAGLRRPGRGAGGPRWAWPVPGAGCCIPAPQLWGGVCLAHALTDEADAMLLEPVLAAPARELVRQVESNAPHQALVLSKAREGALRQ